MLGDQKGKKLYTCFVDFQKAFDSVWHDALFRKIENKGINGNFVNIIKNIYKNTKCAVKIDGKTTKYFKYEKGVQQGNPLSPLLFNLFINDIFEAIKNDVPVTLDGNTTFNALMYADDLIIIATTPEGLQQSLDGLTNYCSKWKLAVNIKKTKCMTFSKGSNVKKHVFKVNDKVVEHTNEYKYLGITINAKNCSFSPALTNLSTKATRAIYALTSKLPIYSAPVKTMLKLFDSCIAPILTYGSEVWAPFIDHDWIKWDSSPIEKVHTQFLKRILGVNRSSTNVMARSELGRHSLQERILKNNITYIRDVSCKNPSTLVYQALKYEESLSYKRNSIFSLFLRHEPNIHLNPDQENPDIPGISTVQNSPLKKIESLLFPKIGRVVRNCFDIEWKNHLATFPKADTFSQFKDTVKYEKYLCEIRNRKHRVFMTKLRLSDHCLTIEEGRHKRPVIPRQERFCPHCPNIVESEKHFLINCIAYDRTNLFQKVAETYPRFGQLNEDSKFIFLMSQENQLLTQEIARSIHSWMTKRLDYKAQQQDLVQYIIIFASTDVI